MENLGDPIKFLDLKYDNYGLTVRIDVDIVIHKNFLTSTDKLKSEEEQKKINIEKNTVIYEDFSKAILTCVDKFDVKMAQEKIMEYIKLFNINPEIQEVRIHKGQKFTIDPYSIVIVNNATSECILTVQCLKTVLTEDILEQYYKRMAGNDTTMVQGETDDKQ